MKKLKKTTEKFIKQLREVHGDKYDYSKVVWKGAYEKITIVCPKHGEFKQSARAHLYKRQGCIKCGTERTLRTRKSIAFTTDKFIEKAKSIHGDKFDYSRVEYKNSLTKVTIGCPVHGWSEIKPRHHYKGTGCYGCGRKKFSETVSKYKSIDELKETFREIHSGKYTYDNLKCHKRGYLKTFDKILITCSKHGNFEQSLASHLAGHGCKECRFYGYTKDSFTSYCKDFNKDKAKVYLLRFSDENEEFYKIGLTARTVKQRFRKESERLGYDIEKIFVGEYDPDIAWDKEDELKDKYLKYKYIPNRKMPGFSECFTSDLPVEEVIRYLNPT